MLQKPRKFAAVKHRKHTLFHAPKNHNQTIVRYMDLAKFVSLLDSSCLFFTRADKFDDPFEGSFPRNNAQTNKGFPQFAEHNRQLRKFTYLNCWNLSEYESAALWQLYTSQNAGVAIKSTYGRLISSLSDDGFESAPLKDRRFVYIGMVDYIDFNSASITEGNTYAPFVFKRLSFEHERELRAVFQSLPSPDASGFTNLDSDSPEGVLVPVDLVKLISEVRISPKAEPWFVEVVESIVKKYGLSISVRQSDLSVDPVY